MPKPSTVIRLLRQFAENERRATLSDMERAWALVALKDALQTEAGSELLWSVVEEQLQISDGRRQAQLITDLEARAALLDEAQRLIARLQSLVSELSATKSA